MPIGVRMHRTGHRYRIIFHQFSLVLMCSFALFPIADSADSQTLSFASILKGMRDQVALISDYQCRFRTYSTDGTESREVLLITTTANPSKSGWRFWKDRTLDPF